MNLKQTKPKSFSLDKIRAALSLLGNPQDSYKAIQVAGTNGKGSVCSFLSLFYRYYFPELKIAKFISPHLLSICERFSINGENISERAFQDISEELFPGQDVMKDFSQGNFRQIPVSGFEQMTLIAFEYFKREQVDIVILETGMGGRLDSTNVGLAKNCLATAITNIGLDHQEYLGDTIEEIRKEKEGIKKEGVPHFELEERNLDLDPNTIKGDNFKLALKIFESITAIKVEAIVQDQVIKTLKLEYPGRLQYFPEYNLLIDGAHNAEAANLLNTQIKVRRDKDIEFYISVLDKDYKTLLDKLLDELDDRKLSFNLVDLEMPRQTTTKLLKEYLELKGYTDIKLISQNEINIQRSQSLKLACGSLYLLGKVLESIAKAT